MEWQIPLGVTALIFGGVVLSRLRPAFGGGGGTARKALAAARMALDKAESPEGRASALAAAGDACSQHPALRNLAAGYYARALKVAPADVTLIHRTAQGLARKPHALESLLVRRLGATKWSDEAVTKALLEELHALYQGRLRSVARAQMIGRALEHVTGAGPASEASPSEGGSDRLSPI